MKENLKKLDKKYIIASFAIFIVFLTLVLVSFALPDFSVNLLGKLNNEIDACEVDVSMEEDSGVELIFAYPLDDDKITNFDPYEVTITNNSDCGKLNFSLNMVSSCDYCVTTDGDCNINGSSCDCEHQIDEDLIKYQVINTSTNEVFTGSNPYEMSGIGTSLEQGESVTFKIRIWISSSATNSDLKYDDNNYYRSKDFCARLVVNTNNKTMYDTIASNVNTSITPNFQYISNYNSSGINTNDNGIFLYNGTDDNGGDKDIYYYRGNVTNNNVIFGGFCWKIIRTTSTGGTKMIYNGTPSDGSCNNTGDATQLSSNSKFNSSNNSPSDAGYMYGTRYTKSVKPMLSITDEYVYGNSVTYADGTYTLVDTITSAGSNWASGRSSIANGHRYTCFSTSSTCSTVYYLYYFGHSSDAYYLTFTDGVDLETAKTNMFTNTNNSTIKTKIDNWYSANLSSYSSYLENTIFCNDRSFASGTLGGTLASKDNSLGTLSDYSNFAAVQRTRSTYSPSLTCTNINDRFSLSTANGGTVSYGNNALTYSIGLLTADEATLAGGAFSDNSNYYLYTGQNYWYMTPGCFSTETAMEFYQLYTGQTNYNNAIVYRGVRPVISLKSSVSITGGNGTVNNPYTVG